MKTRTFKDLVVWQKAFALVKEVYAATEDFPTREVYGLVQQMRRAAMSIPSNIAEGYGRFHSKEYRQFLSIAYGSMCELETQYLLSLDLAYMKRRETMESLMKEVGGMLYVMIRGSHE